MVLGRFELLALLYLAGELVSEQGPLSQFLVVQVLRLALVGLGGEAAGHELRVVFVLLLPLFSLQNIKWSEM